MVYDANIRILSFDVNLQSDEQLTNTKMAFFNGGNAPYLVTKIQLLVGQDDIGEGYLRPDDGVPLAGTLPFVLDKGEMKLVEMKRRGASVFKDTEGVDEQFWVAPVMHSPDPLCESVGHSIVAAEKPMEEG